ncbi:hypothetical protein BJV78DRAFT_1224244 [Lactifluus subvellereus]|nr:hypothetical protein BJV78DRAFT_1261896 [Lactifluus subvellereus]KAI0249720.1 hypothetical protein BJV78DRAFT_1224244 [Lactifluus subvellereus]
MLLCTRPKRSAPITPENAIGLHHLHSYPIESMGGRVLVHCIVVAITCTGLSA